MIGAGVFTTSGLMLAELRAPALVLGVWLTGGALALLGAVSYGALARRFPESGGEYLFLTRTLHPVAGYVAGWISVLAGFSAPLAAVALAFGEYLKPCFSFWTPTVTGSILLVAVAAVHAAHVRRGAAFQTAAVFLKLCLIGILLGWGGGHLHPQAAAGTGEVPFGAFAVSVLWVSFSYSGWNAAVYIGSEVRNPERELPRALVLGTVTVTAVYLALNTVFVYAAPVEQLSGKLEIGRAAAEALGGSSFADFVTSLIALSLATTVSSMLMAGPRVFARMADDGCLPRWFSFPAQGPPRRAILLQCAVALVMLWTATFRTLITYVGFTLGLCSAAAVAGLIRQRRLEGPRLQVPGWPWVPATFVGTMAIISGMTMLQKPLASAIGLGTILIGGLGWHFTRGRARKSGLS
jgi:APA family basic amino acid/polyamine antiporter